jgi:hypothetical protein
MWQGVIGPVKRTTASRLDKAGTTSFLAAVVDSSNDAIIRKTSDGMTIAHLVANQPRVTKRNPQIAKQGL